MGIVLDFLGPAAIKKAGRVIKLVAKHIRAPGSFDLTKPTNGGIVEGVFSNVVSEALDGDGLELDEGESETEIKPGDKTQKGREYTQHGAERANERGFDSQKVDSIIDNNYKHRTKEIDALTGKVTWRYQDKRGNTVITNESGDKIITVYSYPISANSGNYIPKN